MSKKITLLSLGKIADAAARALFDMGAEEVCVTCRDTKR